jgi:N-acetylmuramoyl-L-alanine amidase
VIELDAPATPVRAFILQPTDDGRVGYRFVVDLIDGGPTRFAVARQALAKSRFQPEERAETVTPLSSVPLPASRPDRALQFKPEIAAPITPVQRPKTFVVAIDAGHGGKDPGALGKKGTREKDITLKAAKMLAEELRKTANITPILIRNSDRYYKLRTRIKRARDKQADIFVSLHADSAPNSKARGISVFSLSDRASDKEAAYLAQRENKADLIGGPDLDGEDPVAANALLRMFQRESMNESAKLASVILSNIKDLPGGDKRGHRFAGFAVLKSPDIPSILVEMGFLSNRQDEKNLRDNSYLRGLSKRLARAVSLYLENAES